MDGNKNGAPAAERISLWRSAWRWWKNTASLQGRVAATRQLLAVIFEFLRDSTPERLRLRYGDAEYDWGHRVNTTSGGVGWRERLLGIFHLLISRRNLLYFTK